MDQLVQALSAWKPETREKVLAALQKIQATTGEMVLSSTDAMMLQPLNIECVTFDGGKVPLMQDVYATTLGRDLNRLVKS